MKLVGYAATLALGTILSVSALAAAPADAPAGTTALCKDGSYSSGAKKVSACRGHKGIKEWYAATDAAAPAADAAKADAAKAEAPKAEAPSAAAAPAAPAAAAPATKAVTKAAATKEAAPGDGPGQVWVNSKDKVYHCQGDRWYGKTKTGEYMTEDAAKAAGARPSHGKACS